MAAFVAAFVVRADRPHQALLDAFSRGRPGTRALT
jgi:hypothetical protein